jgi:hypothetical protein
MFRRDVYEELLRAATSRSTVTYGHLMKKFRISRGHPRGAGIVGVIGGIDRHECEKGGPGFAAIVVRKDTGFPGGGYFCYDDIPERLRRLKGQGTNPRLSRAEREYVEGQQRKIWKYYEKRSSDRL